MVQRENRHLPRRSHALTESCLCRADYLIGDASSVPCPAEPHHCRFTVRRGHDDAATLTTLRTHVI